MTDDFDNDDFDNTILKEHPPIDTWYYGLTCDDIIYSTRSDDGPDV